MNKIFELENLTYSQSLQKALDSAYDIAEKKSHEFITPEHLLHSILSMLMADKSQSIDYSVVGQVLKELKQHLLEMETYKFFDGEMVMMSDGLITILENATSLTDNADKTIMMCDVLQSIFEYDEDQFSTYLLNRYYPAEHDRTSIVAVIKFIEHLHEQQDDAQNLNAEDNNAETIMVSGKEMTPDQIKSHIMNVLMNGMPMNDGIHKIEVQEGNIKAEMIVGKMNALPDKLLNALKALSKHAPHGTVHIVNEVGFDGLDGSTDGDEEENEENYREPWEELVTNISDTCMDHKPLVGREAELDMAKRVLCRFEKSNPIFIGEPGVGKSALIYGLAREIELGNVPERLVGKEVYSLNMSDMVAGASFHGEFEKRMKMVLEGARKRGNCIICIDEIHTIMSTSGGNGSINATDLLKPYLEDPAMAFIGCTTYQEYNKTIANNKALARRFHVIDVKEPSAEDAIEIVSALLPTYEKHHGVKYKPDAVKYAVEQSCLHINDRFLPDKAIDIIDAAGAYRQSNPLLNKEGKKKAARYQTVDVSIIKNVLVDICRIDAKALSSEDNKELENLDARIASSIYGQDEAIRQVVRSVMMAKAGLTDTDKPLASLLFVGPTGVGKTEVCKVLAKELGIELVRFDMSEYTEKHTVSKLIGSPAGYVGYDEGGLLTDAIRKTPNCVLLLDEIEKAHSDIYNILLQVMDYAHLTDNKGNKAYFRNVILIMTSNAGAQYASQSAIGFTGGITKGEAMMKTVKKTFKPEFLNRLSGTVVFNDMDEKMASLILDKKLSVLSSRLAEKNVTMTVADDARQYLLKEGFTPEFGAREMDRVVNNSLSPLFMQEILFGKLKKGGNAEITYDGKELHLSVK